MIKPNEALTDEFIGKKILRVYTGFESLGWVEGTVFIAFDDGTVMSIEASDEGAMRVDQVSIAALAGATRP